MTGSTNLHSVAWSSASTSSLEATGFHDKALGMSIVLPMIVRNQTPEQLVNLAKGLEAFRSDVLAE